MSADDIAIKVENLSKCYHVYDKPRDRLLQMLSFGRKHYFREFWALRDVSFEIKKGETVGIIGRNGSGKSTLLQMICGTLNPTGGNILINGRIAALLELGSGFNADFTGRENVYLNGTLLGLSKEEVDKRFSDIEAFAEIGDFIDQPVKTYSSGMFVRLAFAIQANVDPDILIIDEALAVGDTYFVHRCMLRINELQKSGTTILFVSHDANAVRNLCSRAIWLLDGNVQGEGDSSEIVDNYLANLFGHDIVSTKDLISLASDKVSYQNKDSTFEIENNIPNVDRRLGDQKCKLIGVCLYDELMNKISSTLNEKLVILRLTIQNISLESNTYLSIGYIFRNSKGQEIASSNSKIEGQEFFAPTKGCYLTFLVTVELPRLYPDSYSFTITIGYIEYGEEIVMSDRVENAILLELMSLKRVHVMMAFQTEYILEE
jgi:lipopolysaccharide transport system ATP-binding protein